MSNNPSGFEDPYFPDHLYQLDKALYGLKQAPRAWYDHLTELLQDRGFEIGKIDPTLFTKKVKGGCLYANYMLMALSLVPRTKLSMRNLPLT